MEEELCTVFDFPKPRDSRVYLSCTACFSVSLGFDPWCPSSPDQAFQSVFRDPNGSSSNKMRLLLNFVVCLLSLALHLWPPTLTTFLTSWSAFFLTAVQPLLSDGLFCCLKHFIGGQVYIIRGESLSVPQSEVL